MSNFVFLIGALLIFIGSLGLVRLPDIFCRSHATAVSMTLGISLMLIARFDTGLFLMLAILAQFITIPIASHAVAYSARKKSGHGRDNQVN